MQTNLDGQTDRLMTSVRPRESNDTMVKTKRAGSADGIMDPTGVSKAAGKLRALDGATAHHAPLIHIMHHTVSCATAHHAPLHIMHHTVSCTTAHHAPLHIMHHTASCTTAHHAPLMHIMHYCIPHCIIQHCAHHTASCTTAHTTHIPYIVCCPTTPPHDTP